MHDGSHRPTAVAQTSDLPLTEPQRLSYAYCHELTRRRARNFYYGLKLTPEPKRSALYAIYAFMRACDDLADAADTTDAADRSASLQRIESFRQTMQQLLDAPDDAPLPDGEVWPAFRHVMRTYPIEHAHLHLMLDGQLCDIQKNRYATFDDLYDYCFKVASVVGLVCVAVWGHDNHPDLPKLAEHRGLAFQLTNILRDLTEDAQRDRIYLPQHELHRFGYAESNLLAGHADANFDALMHFQIDRAREYYRLSESLEDHLDPKCRATSWAMARIYRGLLERIASNPRSVLCDRIRLSSAQKLTIALRGAWRRSNGK
jgi:phytoene synthase